ncbi:MAG: type I phosphomannose isomerase catalytic subunit [Thermoguttaceae bacterium]
MTKLYPLHFQPLYRRYLWGGRRLESCLKKPLPPGGDYAESWEICDHGADQSLLSDGPLAGKSLGELISVYGREISGKHYPQQQFPLLIKFLDVTKTTSVQVHPNDAQAARLNPPDTGKTEAWVVLEAEPGSRIHAGLKSGVSRADLEAAVKQGRCQDCLHSFEPQAGDCVYLPAGVVHSLGAGLLVAEIQQSSDTTFRLFDWNREGPDGKPRPLHVEQALNIIDYRFGPVTPLRLQASDSRGKIRLISGDKFVLDRRESSMALQIGGDERFHILIVIAGSLLVAGYGESATLSKGSTVLLPACLGSVRIEPQQSAALLDVFLPD